MARFPLREGLRQQHMLALYRSGRQAEALAAIRRPGTRLPTSSESSPRRRFASSSGRCCSRTLPSNRRRHRRTRGRARARQPALLSEAPVSDVAYARSGDVRIAYQVVGDGPIDLILVHGWVCTFQPGWEYPKLAAFYRRLASMGRLILFDKRGTGLSDRVSTGASARSGDAYGRRSCGTGRRRVGTGGSRWASPKEERCRRSSPRRTRSERRRSS